MTNWGGAGEIAHQKGLTVLIQAVLEIDKKKTNCSTGKCTKDTGVHREGNANGS